MMIRKLALAALAVVAFGGQFAHAKSQPCRDAKGKFTKCKADAAPKDDSKTTAPATPADGAPGKN